MVQRTQLLCRDAAVSMICMVSSSKSQQLSAMFATNINQTTSFSWVIKLFENNTQHVQTRDAESYSRVRKFKTLIPAQKMDSRLQDVMFVYWRMTWVYKQN